MEFAEIILEHEPPLARIILNRPEKINALSITMVTELARAMDQLAGDPETRVVILSARGKHFCAGHLLSEMTGKKPTDYDSIFQACTGMMQRLHALPQPVIAQVHGVATAGGCQLVAACDLAVAADNARFATPGVNIGLFCSTPAVPLVRAVGRKRALEMLFTGEWLGAQKALEWGLVNRLAPPGELAGAAESWALEIAQASPLTLALGKRVFYDQVDRPEPEAYNLATTAMGLSLATDDAQEGISAFLEKRDPAWRGS